MYYVVEIGTGNDGSVAKAIWDKDSLDNAVMAYHQTLASAMANVSVKSMMCMVIDGRGAVQIYDFWERATGEDLERTAEEE